MKTTSPAAAPAVARERRQRNRARGNLALHVERAAPPDLAVDKVARERPALPLGRIREHDVGVREQRQRRAVAGPAQAGDEVGAPGSRRTARIRYPPARDRRAAARQPASRCRADWWCRAGSAPAGARRRRSLAPAEHEQVAARRADAALRACGSSRRARRTPGGTPGRPLRSAARAARSPAAPTARTPPRAPRRRRPRARGCRPRTRARSPRRACPRRDPHGPTRRPRAPRSAPR